MEIIKIFIFILWLLVFACTSHECPVPTKARRQYQIPPFLFTGGKKDGCEHLCGSWELRSLQRHQVLLNAEFYLKSLISEIHCIQFLQGT